MDTYDFMKRTRFIPIIILWLGVIAMVVMFACAVWASEYSDTDIVNAIYKIEGSTKAQYLYGIRSVKYSNEAEARRICMNTVRNNRVRFTKQSKYKDYLSFLASRYCPVNCDNDRGTNKFWLRNLKYWLEKGV